MSETDSMPPEVASAAPESVVDAQPIGGQLRAAREAAHLSVDEVASALKFSPRQIAALEEHLGIKLMVRTTRRLTLTAGGAAYLEKCREILDLVETAEAIRDVAIEQGMLTLKMDGLEKVRMGRTSIEEIVRVIV